MSKSQIEAAMVQTLNPVTTIKLKGKENKKPSSQKTASEASTNIRNAPFFQRWKVAQAKKQTGTGRGTRRRKSRKRKRKTRRKKRRTRRKSRRKRRKKRRKTRR